MRVAVLALGLVTGAAQAALPPKYQRQRELAAVLEAAVERLDEPVDSIAAAGEDRYRVIAGRCTVIARIRGLPMGGMVGARRFRVELERPACR